MEKIDLRQIKITDPLFGTYTSLVAEKMIPYQWKILNDQLEGVEPSHCIHNFRVASGELYGERLGVVFIDTDLYKWLESVAYCIENGSGTAYEKTADEVIRLIGKAQEKDGYLNTYYSVNAPEKKWTNLTEGHELYTAGHMIEAAVAYYHATGKEAFLDIACRNADLICRVFGTGEGQKRGYPGHQEIELALVKLYRTTGRKQYLDCAEYFIRERGKKPNYLAAEIAGREKGYELFPEFSNYDLNYSQCQEEPVKQKSAEGHAVRAMYMYSAMADLALETEDKELAEAVGRLWDSVTKKRMYITGGIGSSGLLERFTTDYDLPNRTDYSESCASIGLMMFGQRMNALTGEAACYDTVERALYNTVLAGIAQTGERYFYVNPLEMVPEFCTEHTYMEHVKPVRQKWYSVACCPTNIARTLASLGQYIYAKQDNSLYIQQFISSELTAEVRTGTITLKMESNLLQNGKIHLQVQVTGGPIDLKIRIPDYAEQPAAVLDGIQIQEVQDKVKQDKGYLVISIGSGIHQMDLDFHIQPRWMAANDLVREDMGKVALMKGPCVYCLEEIDNGKNLSAIYIKPDTSCQDTLAGKGITGDWPALSYEGIRLSANVPPDQLYGLPEYEEMSVLLKAVPYCLWNNRGEGEMLIWQKVKL